MLNGLRVAVVIPCFKVRAQILEVLSGIPPEIDEIICVDDGCPDHSGSFITENCRDPRLTILFNDRNQGVGGAVMTGYRHCIQRDRFDVVVKLDGDNQMDPARIPDLLKPIREGLAGYSKGNRFGNLRVIHKMPLPRLLGNLGVSLICRFSSGYWHIQDSANGYTAISTDVLKNLPLDKISRNYFFESDMLCHLYYLRTAVTEVGMDARYGSETSNVNELREIIIFAFMHAKRFLQRIFRMYVRKPAAGTIPLALAAAASAAVPVMLMLGKDMTGILLCTAIAILFLVIFFIFDLSGEPRGACRRQSANNQEAKNS